TDEHGEGFHFYRSPLIEQWQTDRKKTQSEDGGTITKLKGELGRDTRPRSTATPPPPGLDDGLHQLGRELFLEPPDAVARWADLLLDSRQVIFQGPPGTGKTFIARKLAAAVA